MGRTILPLVAASADLRLSGGLAVAGDPALGRDAGELVGVDPCSVIVTDDLARALEQAQVAIDFTRPTASVAHARACRDRRCALVIGTTGHDAAERREIEAVARSIPVVFAPNMSIGVNLLLRLAELAARSLPPAYDAEIIEAHHRDKVDAPSGTALALGEAVARGRQTTLDTSAVYSRVGTTGPRVPGAIGFAVIRGGDIVGDHRLVLAGPGERIELTHVAHDRTGFARGALQAARWVAGRPPGLYGMQDVLGI
jgi:4-hydroxy-tetrahydrodipicolinate reductase